MTSINRIIKPIFNVNNIKINSIDICKNNNDETALHISAELYKKDKDKCPFCLRKCTKYDKSNNLRTWRHMDCNGILVYIHCNINRVFCPEHGVVSINVPWAYPNSNFTKAFDLNVAYMATECSKQFVSEYMRIDWKTVGRCFSRAFNDIEPNLKDRYNNLVNIGIDETSYKKGHKYITVIVNHDTNTVIWMHEGHGKEILDLFFNELTEKQKASIRVVTGDGAKWITNCVNEHLNNCTRCVDQFHVVEWAMETLNEIKTSEWHAAVKKVKEVKGNIKRGKGRPKKEDKQIIKEKEAEKIASEIKNSKFALGKAPENLTEKQKVQLEMISTTSPRVYRAYTAKETLRLLLKLKNADEAEKELKSWYWKASHSRIPELQELARKIKRHKEHILNTIKTGMSNARIESTNNKIKLIIRKAYGFRNIKNMMDMIYIVCSNLTINLPNRKKKNKKALQTA